MQKVVLALLLVVFLNGCQPGSRDGADANSGKSDPVKYLESIKEQEVFGDLNYYTALELEIKERDLRRQFKTPEAMRAAMKARESTDTLKLQTQAPGAYKPVHAQLIEGHLSHLLGLFAASVIRDKGMQGIAVYNLYGGLQGFTGSVTSPLCLSDEILKKLPRNEYSSGSIVFSLTEQSKGLYALIVPAMSGAIYYPKVIGFTIFYFRF